MCSSLTSLAAFDLDQIPAGLVGEDIHCAQHKHQADKREGSTDPEQEHPLNELGADLGNALVQLGLERAFSAR